MVSESPGRNESKRIGGLENINPGGRAPLDGVKGNMDCRNLTDATDHSGGVVATAQWQGCTEQLEKPSSPRREIGGAKRSRITGYAGKTAERREGDGWAGSSDEAE